MRRLVPAALLLLVTGACATSGSVRRVETQILVLRTEAARQDSARAADLSRIMALQAQVADSLGVLREALRGVRSDMASELFEIQQQLVQVQELTGQSQRRLSELKAQLETRSLALDASRDSTGVPGDAAAMPSADQMFQGALGQLRRGSLGTARIAFREFLRTYPTDPQVPAALLFLGETFAGEAPDSAAFYYQEVATRHQDSDRAATALYKLGQIAELRQDVAGARTHYQQLVQRYPRSIEANLARDRLTALRP